MDKIIKKAWPFILLLVLSYSSIRPLIEPGFFPVHDDTQIARVYEMAKALKDMQLPVRWVSDIGYGYGYPIFNFYAPLPYYFGGMLSVIGIDVITSTKLMFLFGTLFATFTMYMLAKEIFGKWGGLLSAIVYTYAPYRALDIYVRGAVGEFWAMAFLPLVFLGFYKLSENKYSQFWINLTAFSLAGVILSHNITGMIVVFGTFIYLAIRIIYLISTNKNIRSIYGHLLAVCFGIGMSTFFWLPALVEKDFTSVSQLTTGGADYHLHFVRPEQLWDSPWGYGGSASGLADGLSFKIGKLAIVLSTLGFLFFILNYKRLASYNRLIASIVIITLVSIYMSLDSSLSVWELVQTLAFVQFPWRLLLFAAFGTSLLSASLVLSFNKLGAGLFIAVCTITILYNTKYFLPKYVELKREDSYTNRTELQWRVSRISDEYMPLEFKRPQNIQEIRGDSVIKGDRIKITKQEIKSNSIILQLKNVIDQQVELAIASFPGWKVFVQGIEVTPRNHQGRIVIDLPKGELSILAVLTNTPVRIIGNFISLITFLTSLMFLYVYGKKNSAR